MGRGSSKAGGGGGGGATAPQANPQANPQGVPQMVAPTPDANDVKNGNILPPGGVAFSDFENMTDDQKADVVDQAMKSGVPMFLEDSPMQRFAYFTGMSDKPTVVSDSQLNGISGEDIYRTVNDAYNSRLDLGYTSRDIARQIMEGDFTMYSDSGGSAYGKAIYFSNNYNGSAAYGNSNKHAVTMRAKITGKSISESSLDRMYSNALSRGDKLARACSRSGNDRKTSRNLYGLAKGYDAMTTSGYDAYQMIFNRRGLTCSSTVKPTKYGGSW